MVAPFPSFNWTSAGYWQLLKGKSCSPSTFPHGDFPRAIPVSGLEKETRAALGPAESNVSGAGQCHAGHPGRSLQLHTQCRFKPFNFGFDRTLRFSLLHPPKLEAFSERGKTLCKEKVW